MVTDKTFALQQCKEIIYSPHILSSEGQLILMSFLCRRMSDFCGPSHERNFQLWSIIEMVARIPLMLHWFSFHDIETIVSYYNISVRCRCQHRISNIEDKYGLPQNLSESHGEIVTLLSHLTFAVQQHCPKWEKFCMSYSQVTTLLLIVFVSFQNLFKRGTGTVTLNLPPCLPTFYYN